MRESVGGSFLLYICIFFILAVMIMFVSVLSYNKAFKVKNRIIEIIEAHGSFFASNDDGSAEKDIIDFLKSVGYNVGYDKNFKCKELKNATIVKKHDSDKFEYCVYEYAVDKKKYYKVVTYAYFKFPIIDSVFKYEIRGETKLM